MAGCSQLASLKSTGLEYDVVGGRRLAHGSGFVSTSLIGALPFDGGGAVDTVWGDGPASGSRCPKSILLRRGSQVNHAVRVLRGLSRGVVCG